MYYIFMISNNYNQTLYSFQVVVYFFKKCTKYLQCILKILMQNTDTYMLPPSHFFEIILSFFRNYLYMGWKFLRQIVPEKIDLNSLRKWYFASGTYTLSLYTQVTIIISLFLSLSPLSFTTFSQKSKKSNSSATEKSKQISEPHIPWRQ